MDRGKKPYYGQATKREVVRQFESGRSSASELAELHGTLGSSTISDWRKKFGNSPVQKPPDMEKGTSTAGEGKERRRRQYTDVVKSGNGQVSVTQSGSPYDNAVAERMNGN